MATFEPMAILPLDCGNAPAEIARTPRLSKASVLVLHEKVDILRNRAEQCRNASGTVRGRLRSLTGLVSSVDMMMFPFQDDVSSALIYSTAEAFCHSIATCRSSRTVRASLVLVRPQASEIGRMFPNPKSRRKHVASKSRIDVQSGILEDEGRPCDIALCSGDLSCA